jgi:hypothetical protein
MKEEEQMKVRKGIFSQNSYMKKHIGIRKHVLFKELQVKQERICQWTCACKSTQWEGDHLGEKGEQ